MSTSGLLHALLLDGRGGARHLEWPDILAWKPADGLLWLNLDYSTTEVTDWLATKSQLDALTISALTDSDPRPRAIAHGENLLLLMRGINNNAGAEPEDMISVRAWIEPRRVLTLRHRPSTSVRSIVIDLDRNAGPRTAPELALLLVERMVEHVVSRVDTLGDAVAACEDRVARPVGRDSRIDDTGAVGPVDTGARGSAAQRGDLRHELAEHRRRAIALRRFLAPQRDALARLGSIAVPWLDPPHRARIGEVSEDMMRAIEELDAARDRAAVTQEELSSRVAEIANQRLYVLSIITAFFLPLGFVCALLGVNVGGVPLQQDNWAFWALCGVFLIGVLAQLWFFRKRGWL